MKRPRTVGVETKLKKHMGVMTGRQTEGRRAKCWGQLKLLSTPALTWCQCENMTRQYNLSAVIKLCSVYACARRFQSCTSNSKYFDTVKEKPCRHMQRESPCDQISVCNASHICQDALQQVGGVKFGARCTKMNLQVDHHYPS
jgi:hypothetical protein